MKKLLYIFVACAAFAVGILGYSERPHFMPIPLYEITRNPELYKCQKIHIKAYLDARKFNSKDLADSEIYSSLFDYKKFCVKDCFEGASLQLPENIESNKELSKLVNELTERNSQVDVGDGSYFAEVEIVGEIEKINACFAPPYVVKADSVKQTSPIQFISHSEVMEIAGRK